MENDTTKEEKGETQQTEEDGETEVEEEVEDEEDEGEEDNDCKGKDDSNTSHSSNTTDMMPTKKDRCMQLDKEVKLSALKLQAELAYEDIMSIPI